MLVCDKEGPIKSIHCLEHGTSHGGYKTPCCLPGWARQAWKQCGLLAGYFFQMCGCLCCFMISKVFYNLVNSVILRKWGLWVMQVEWLLVHGLTPLDWVCQQALELFLPVITRTDRKGVWKSAECSCPSWPCIHLLWLVCAWREQRGWKEGYQVWSCLTSRLVPGRWLERSQP